MPKTRSERVGSILCALAVAGCAWVYIRSSVLHVIPTLAEPADFGAYFQAAKNLLNGKSPYSDPAVFYPPLLAFLMVPFGTVDYVTARWVWFVVSHLFVIGAGGVLWRRMGGGRLALCCIACVWALGGALRETLMQGQLSALLVLVLTIAYTQGDRLRGSFAGLVFALKYFPGIVSLPLLLGRRWRGLGASVAVALAGVCVPWIVLAAFFTGPRAPSEAHFWMGTPGIWSWSAPSVVLRFLTPILPGAPLPSDWEFGNVASTLHLAPRLKWISVATGCVVLAGGIAALVAVCRGRLQGPQIRWAMAGLVALSLAVAPVSWTHYQLMQYPGVAMLLIAALRRRDWLMAGGTALCFALAYQLPVHLLVAYHDRQKGWTTASPATLYFWTSVPVLATLAIFAFTLVMVRRERD